MRFMTTERRRVAYNLAKWVPFHNSDDEMEGGFAKYTERVEKTLHRTNMEIDVSLLSGL